MGERMATTRVARRILVAVTEASPVERLWQATLDLLREEDAEVAVLILRDDRWQRAASLPFTHEISRVGGLRSDFTRERAETLAEEAIARLQSLTQSLASEANVRCSYHIIADAALEELERLIDSRQSTLVASTVFARLPLYEELQSLNCEIVFVDRTADDVGADS